MEKMETMKVFAVMVQCLNYAPGSEPCYSSDLVCIRFTKETAERAVFEWNEERSAKVTKKGERWESSYSTSWSDNYEFYLREEVIK